MPASPAGQAAILPRRGYRTTRKVAGERQTSSPAQAGRNTPTLTVHVPRRRVVPTFQYQVNELLSVFTNGNVQRFQTDNAPWQSYQLYGVGGGMSFRFIDPLFKSELAWSIVARSKGEQGRLIGLEREASEVESGG